MKSFFSLQSLKGWAQLLRWDKPSGRLILLIPAGWSLWLTPTSPPQIRLIALIAAGGLFVSGAGCIVNDLWDKEIDIKVARTVHRPLGSGRVHISTAFILLLIMLSLSLLVIFYLPTENRELCLKLALFTLPPVLIYPSAKRWFSYPQALLAICWGFAVLIPWAASEGNLSGGLPLFCCWGATLLWTFGFDTVYALSDREDDIKLSLNSSAISLGKNVFSTIRISYGTACFLLAIAGFSAGVNWKFWPIWILVSLGMQREVFSLKKSQNQYGNHFKNQVLLGALILLGLIIGRAG